MRSKFFIFFVCLLLLVTPVFANPLVQALVGKVLPPSLQTAYAALENPSGAALQYVSSAIYGELDPKMQQVVGNMESYAGIAQFLFKVNPQEPEAQALADSVVYDEVSGEQMYLRENGAPFVSFSEGVAMEYQEESGVVTFTNTNDDSSTLTFGDLSLQNVAPGSSVTYLEDTRTGMVTLQGVSGDVSLGQTTLRDVTDGTFMFSQNLDENGKPTGDYNQVEYASFTSRSGSDYHFDYAFPSGSFKTFDFSTPKGGAVEFDPQSGVLHAESLVMSEVGVSEYGSQDIVRQLRGDRVRILFDDAGKYTQITLAGKDAEYVDTEFGANAVYPYTSGEGLLIRNPAFGAVDDTTTLYFNQPLPLDAPSNALAFYEETPEGVGPVSSLVHIESRGIVSYRFQGTELQGDGRANLLARDDGVQTFHLVSGSYVKNKFVSMDKEDSTTPVSVRVNPDCLKKSFSSSCGYGGPKFLIVQEVGVPYIEVSGDGVVSAVDPTTGKGYEVSAGASPLLVDYATMLEKGKELPLESSRLVRGVYVHRYDSAKFEKRVTETGIVLPNQEQVDIVFRDIAQNRLAASGIDSLELSRLEDLDLLDFKQTLREEYTLDTDTLYAQARASLYQSTGRSMAMIIAETTSDAQERLALAALMRTESGGSLEAVNDYGFVGPMQFGPSAAKATSLGTDGLMDCCSGYCTGRKKVCPGGVAGCLDSQKVCPRGLRFCNSAHNACRDAGYTDPRFDPERVIPAALELFHTKEQSLTSGSAGCEAIDSNSENLWLLTVLSYNAGQGTACRAYHAAKETKQSEPTLEEIAEAISPEMALAVFPSSWGLTVDDERVLRKQDEMKRYVFHVTDAVADIEDMSLFSEEVVSL